MARGQHGDPAVLVGVADAPGHLQRLGHLGQGQGQLAAGQLEASSMRNSTRSEEHAFFFVVVLVGLGHVPAVAEDELGDGGNQAGTVGGGQ